MKTLRFYVIDDKPEELFWVKHHNSLFRFDGDKVIFNNKLDAIEEEVEIQAAQLILDESLAAEFKMFEIAKEDADQLSDEPIQENFDTRAKFTSMINSSIQYCSYQPNYSIFEFVCEIFIKLLMFHSFQNGNKRFALSYLVSLLRFLGFHFKWSKGLQKNYKVYEDQVAEFVKMFSRCDNTNNQTEVYDSAKQLVLQWIKDNCVIAIKFVH